MAKKSILKRALIVDVGTVSVSAGVLSLRKVGNPILSMVERVPISSGEKLSREALGSATTGALKTLLERFSKEHFKEVHIILASPWHTAHARNIVATSKKPIQISEKTMEHAVEDYQAEVAPKEGNVDAEAVAFQVKVNGYSTRLKRPVVGQKLSVNVYESEVNPDIKKNIQHTVESFFPHSTVSYNTFPLVSTVALRTVVPETSFMVIDFAGEMTEITLMYEDALQHLASFPIGYYTIARSMTTKTGTMGDTLSRLALFARDELSDKETEVLQKKFSEAFLQWKTSFEEVLNTALETSPLSHTVFLISDKEQLGWLKKGFDTLDRSDFSVTTVGAPLVQNFVELGEGGVYDIFLSFSSIFFHTGARDIIGE